MWDQRGEGKSFARSGTSVAETMTIERFTKDGIEVAEHLRRHLGKRKIILLGHSWGSQLGVHMVRVRPDLFSVYVGTGQVTNLPKQAAASYPLLLDRALKAGNDTAHQQLIDAGPPPYGAPIVKWIPWLIWANELDPAPASSSLPSAGALWLMAQRIFGARGIPADAQFSQEALWGEMIADDLPSLGLEFDAPVVFIQGTDDILTVTAVAKDYFDSIEAPSKEFVLLPGAGHLAIFRARDAFLEALLDHVRPLAMQSEERGEQAR
jgi:pimeloyl-ACP methyl ester carboxylesterase